MSLLSLSHYYNYVIVCIFYFSVAAYVFLSLMSRMCVCVCVCVCVCINSYNALNDIERIKIEEWKFVRGSGGRVLQTANQLNTPPHSLLIGAFDGISAMYLWQLDH